MQHAHRTLGLKGVKFGPIYNGVALSDPRRDPVYGYCQANNLPLTLQRGTTFTRNAPIDLGRAIHVEPVALRYPDLTIMLAYRGHPWQQDAIVVARKQPHVFLKVSAIFYRPRQFYNTLICAQDYKVTDKICFGTDFPFARVDQSGVGLLQINDQIAGTKLPRVSADTVQCIRLSGGLRQRVAMTRAILRSPSPPSPAACAPNICGAMTAASKFRLSLSNPPDRQPKSWRVWPGKRWWPCSANGLRCGRVTDCASRPTRAMCICSTPRDFA